eukprot:4531800-Ditylum_brightwellii.AAC.1
MVAVRGHDYASDQGTGHPGWRRCVLTREESTKRRRPTGIRERRSKSKTLRTAQVFQNVSTR